MNWLFIAISIIYALMCLAPATMKLSGTAQMRAAAEHAGLPWTRFRAIGLLELAAAAGLLIGIYWRPIGLAAALGMTALLTGALIFHKRASDKFGDYVAALVFLVVSIIYLAFWLSV
ncbi:DoxX family protein [Mycobacterium sp. BMJ-28]